MIKLIFHKLTIITLLIFNSLSIISQNVIIQNDLTGFPIEGATIFNHTQKKSTLSDKFGIFSLDIFSKNDTLTIRHISFNAENRTILELKEMNYSINLLPTIFLMKEFSVIASVRENPDELPYKIDIIDAKNISLTNAQTSADILKSTGNVMVQKSQGGGGSPILRGFEANKILLLIDLYQHVYL